MQSRMQIIVARYNEPLDWVANMHRFDEVIVYNKGNPVSDITDAIVLPNVGREAHTYLHHIIAHYDDIADYTCFLQGHPFDHAPDVIAELEQFNGADYYVLSNRWIECRLSGCMHHYGLPLKEHYEMFFADTEYNLQDKPFLFGAGAEFIVSRRTIHSRPREFYEQLIKIVADSKDAIGAWTLERLWGFVFNHPHILEYEEICTK